MNASMSFMSMCILILSMNYFDILNMFRPSIHELLELEKCPACYGVSECNNIEMIQIDNINSPWDLLQTKNVFYGILNGTKVVVKKLASTDELRTFDQKFKDLNYSDQNIDFLHLVTKEINLSFAEDADSRLRLCPTTEQRDNLFANIYKNRNKNIHSNYSDVHLWTLLKINPEPLMLQILRAEDGWPVPKYIGACGRVIVEEYIGDTLFSYERQPWIVRAKITLSLVDAVYKFTFKHKDFGFYLTDITSLNIAVDRNYVAKVIDLENVIVVDKRIKSNLPSTLHLSQAGFACVDCYEFSPIDICSHSYSDHNHLALCMLLFSAGGANYSFRGGFLQDVPSDISKKYPELQNIIQDCITPTRSDRILAIQKLADLIRIVINAEKNRVQ